MQRINKQKHPLVLSKTDLGQVKMKESCPWKEGHPLNQVHISEQFYEKKFDPFVPMATGRLSNNEGDGYENVT